MFQFAVNKIISDDKKERKEKKRREKIKMWLILQDIPV
jgi:hypothetical protein